jgi:hypothetical protein
MIPVAGMSTASAAILVGGIVGSGWLYLYTPAPINILPWYGLTIWVAAPYVLMLIPVVLANTLRSQFTILVLSAILVFGGLLLYLDAIFWHPYEHGELVFLILPLYQYVAVVAIVCGVFYARVRARMAANRTFKRDARESGARPSM